MMKHHIQLFSGLALILALGACNKTPNPAPADSGAKSDATPTVPSAPPSTPTAPPSSPSSPSSSSPSSETMPPPANPPARNGSD